MLLMQRHWRNAIEYRIALYQDIKHNWISLEVIPIRRRRQLIKPKSQPRIAERIENTAKIVQSVPDDEKDRLIRAYIHKLTVDYYESIHRYKLLELATIQQMQVNGEYQGRYRDYTLRLKMPAKPRLKLSSCKESLKEIICNSAGPSIDARPMLSFSKSLLLPKS